MIHRYEREMTISQKDFYRLLPFALKNFEYSISDNIIYISKGKLIIEIHPGQEYSRSIASLKLPVLKVVFIFKKVSDEDVVAFLNNFSRVYQKGGG